jgi:hypothetical protein
LETVDLSWLILSLCLWLLVVLPFVGLCVSTKTIDRQLARQDKRPAR